MGIKRKKILKAKKLSEANTRIASNEVISRDLVMSGLGEEDKRYRGNLARSCLNDFVKETRAHISSGGSLDELKESLAAHELDEKIRVYQEESVSRYFTTSWRKSRRYADEYASLEKKRSRLKRQILRESGIERKYWRTAVVQYRATWRFPVVSLHIYFGGADGTAFGPGHGHHVWHHLDGLIYKRDPGEPRGPHNFISENYEKLRQRMASHVDIDIDDLPEIGGEADFSEEVDNFESIPDSQDDELDHLDHLYEFKMIAA